MIPVRSRHVDGSVFETMALPAPVPGLAIGRDECMGCKTEAYVLLHVRSGTSLLSAHSAETFGSMWEVLAWADWTTSAMDLAHDPVAALVIRLLYAREPDTFFSSESPAELLVDLNVL